MLSELDSKLTTDLGWDLIFIFIHYKIIDLDSITNENNKEHNEKLPYIPDYPYRILIIVGSGSGKRTHCLI